MWAFGGASLPNASRDHALIVLAVVKPVTEAPPKRESLS